MKRYTVWVKLQGHWQAMYSGLAAWQVEAMGLTGEADIVVEEEIEELKEGKVA